MNTKESSNKIFFTAVKRLLVLIVLMHAINYFNHVSVN